MAAVKSFARALASNVTSRREAEAVIDGLEKRLDKSYDMLLDCITATTATPTADASLCLIHDGGSCTLDDSKGELGNAIIGTLTTSPVDDTVTE